MIKRSARVQNLPFAPCLIPDSLDFGVTPFGEKVGRIGGVCNWKGSAQITAAIKNDNSGGLFTNFSLGVYDVEASDPGDGGGPPHRPLTWQLVATATGDGTKPLPVAPGQTVGATLFFNAPAQGDGKQYTADIQILTGGGTVAATIPVSAIVGAPDVSAYWTLANPYGIVTKSLSTSDPLDDVWNAGHVNDVLLLGGQNQGALLVGTDDAGIWLVSLPGGSIAPLTGDWDTNAVRCLAQGPHGPNHVYGGTSSVDGVRDAVLYESENAVSQGSWRDISPRGVGATIYKVAVTNSSPRRIVVASSGGVFWSNVPPPGGSHQWKQVTKQKSGQPFPSGVYAGLTPGLNDRIVVAAWGADIARGHYGIFYGDWSSGDLVMTPSQLPSSTLAAGMGRTSLTSSPQNPLVMYAVSANPAGGGIWAFLASSDGGQTWIQRTTPAPGVPFNQGDYNNCLAVSPFASDVVALGWQKHFVSRDGGVTWKVFDVQAGLLGLHDDVHSVYFDPTGSPQERLYVCSDGGLVMTADNGMTFDSSFNRYLANLECYCSIARNFFGSLSVRGNFLATGLQDNGNAYCALRSSSSGSVTPWVEVQDGGGDGGWVALIDTGQLITTPNSGASQAFWPRSSIPFDIDLSAPLPFDKGVTVPVRKAGVDDKGGLTSFALEPVKSPNHTNLRNQKMYAIASQSGNTQVVYGLFADQNGTDLHWEQVGSVASDASGDAIWSLAALDDGSSVLAGTKAGRIFLLKLSPSGPVAGQELAVSLPPGTPQGQVLRIIFISATLAFATYTSYGSGLILRFDGNAWSRADSGLPGGPYYGLARDGYGRTWTCTDNQVFVSRDDGFTWKNASLGLPKRAHCAELRYNFAQPNPPLLYVSTYGHSVWVTDVSEV